MPASTMLGQRAVVLGASFAGLLAARVLSERFAEVVLLGRDLLPRGPAARKGMPHATHPHGLLARGRELLEDLFPGFTQAMVERGGQLGDLQRDIAFDVGRQRLAGGTAGLPGIAVSRVAIEAELRQRVLALPGVRVVEEVDVLAPLADAQGRIMAARYATRDEAQRELQLPADFASTAPAAARARPPGWAIGATRRRPKRRSRSASATSARISNAPAPSRSVRAWMWRR